MPFTGNKYHKQIFIEPDFDNPDVTQCCQNIYSHIYLNLDKITPDTRLEQQYFWIMANKRFTLQTMNTALVRLSSHCGLGMFDQFFYLVDIPLNKYKEVSVWELDHMIKEKKFRNLITNKNLNIYEFDMTYKTYFNLRAEALEAMRVT